MAIENDFAVRVKHLSKIYQLWSSPREQWVTKFKRGMGRLLSQSYPETKEMNREFYALNDISLDIKKGESWGFVGVNGSGKSTLLKIISGNLMPSSGCVEVDGKVAILDYGSGFNGDFTGKENIYIKATLLGLSRKKIHERYQSIVEFAELGDFIYQPVKTYSSGMVSRLGFAIMAHVDADIIITDEALAVGDVFFVKKCMCFIQDFLKKGTFLFVSHSVNDVIALCQNAVWLDKGVVKVIGPAATVAKAYLDKDHVDVTARNVFHKAELSSSSQTEENESAVMVLGKPISKSFQKRENHFSEKSAKTKAEINSLLTEPVFELDGNQDVGGVTILHTSFCNERGEVLSQIVGGELIKLKIEAEAKIDLQSPVMDFQLLDRLGQILFSGNSYSATLNRPFSVEAGDPFSIQFVFFMPLLPSGSYVFRVGVALVDSEMKVKRLQTVNNALAIHSVPTGARHGLVGIPMHSIKIKCQHVANGE